MSTTKDKIHTLFPNFEVKGQETFHVIHKPTLLKSIDLGNDLWHVLAFISKLDEKDLLKPPYHLWFDFKNNDTI